MQPSSRLSQHSQQQLQLQKRQTQQLQPQQGPRITAVRCNLCRKPLCSTVFVLACNCLICEDCTVSHFATNPNCPICNRTMRDTDFKELMIARPPTQNEANQSVYKQIFIKSSPQSKTLHSDDLWNRIQRQSQMHRDGTKFVFRQFLRENVAQTRNFVRIRSTLGGMKDEQSSLKQELNKQKEITESYKKELLVAREKIAEKDRQLAQFRKMFESRTPQSPSSIVSGGSRGGIPHVLEGGAIVAPTRPRRVSDQHGDLVGNVRHDEQYQRAGKSYSPSQPLGSPAPPNPYQQQQQQQLHGGRNRGTIMPPPPINPYSKASSRPLSQQNQNRPVHVPNNSNFAMHNPYQKTTGSSGSYRPHSSPEMTRQPNAMTMSQQSHHQQQRSGSNHHTHYNGSSGGSVASRRSTGSGSSGGRIRHITASTGYSFSGGAAASSAEGGRKRSLSPSSAYAGNRGSGSYHHSHQQQQRHNNNQQQQHNQQRQAPRRSTSYHQQQQQQTLQSHSHSGGGRGTYRR
uniref:RING-type domain-containing protein n=1 Tax=Pseudo-nitzschia australis TaxID=44445 RepID=A0A7S4AFE3_9STRA|mmetsp:Transcript_8427/g.18179  ORF Transcript_8427/g.18179 Transcript_8427/m.18179 type:complete len:514 (-) Transcript_8427:314-1855(-)